MLRKYLPHMHYKSCLEDTVNKVICVIEKTHDDQDNENISQLKYWRRVYCNPTI